MASIFDQKLKKDPAAEKKNQEPQDPIPAPVNNTGKSYIGSLLDADRGRPEQTEPGGSYMGDVLAGRNPAPYQAPEPQEEPGYNVLGGLQDIAKMAYDTPVHTLGAAARIFDDPVKEGQWSDRAIEKSEARTDQRNAELTPEERQQKIVPMFRVLDEDGAITRGDVLDASGSTGFSLASLAGSALGGLAAAAVPVPGARVSGAVAGGFEAARRMDKNMISRELLKASDETFMEQYGRPMTDTEKQQLLDENADIINNHALWEAGPEAIGNVIMLRGAGKIFDGILKKAIPKAAAGLGMNLGGELATETTTQMGQQRAEVDLGMRPGEEKRDWGKGGDWGKSLQEVGPSTLLLAGGASAAAAGAGTAKSILRDKFGNKSAENQDLEGELENDPLGAEVNQAVDEEYAGLAKEDSDAAAADELAAMLTGADVADDTDLQARVDAVNQFLESPDISEAAKQQFIDSGVFEFLGIPRPGQGPMQTEWEKQQAAARQYNQARNTGQAKTMTDEEAEYQQYEPNLPPDRRRQTWAGQAGPEMGQPADIDTARDDIEWENQRRRAAEYNRLKNAPKEQLSVAEQEFIDAYESQDVNVPGDQRRQKYAGTQAPQVAEPADIETAKSDIDWENQRQRAAEYNRLKNQPKNQLSEEQRSFLDAYEKQEVELPPDARTRRRQELIKKGNEQGLNDAENAELRKLSAPAARAAELVTNADSVAHGQEVATEPTEGQKSAENYKTAKVSVDGLKLSIENPAGSTRSGTDQAGKQWSQKMVADYGRILGSKGYDKDHVDVFVKPGYKGGSEKAYVINQHNEDGSFDEHKTVIGAESEAEALQIYKANYEPGWTGGRAVTPMSMDNFRTWVKSKGPGRGALKRKTTVEASTLSTNSVVAQNQGRMSHKDWFATKNMPKMESAPETTGDSRPIEQGDIEKAFPGSKVTDVSTDDSRAFAITTPSQGMVVIYPDVDEIRVANPEKVRELWGDRDDIDVTQAVGSFTRLGRTGLIKLVNDGDARGSLDHETYHAAESMVLNDAEIASLERRYGNEEARAEAYREFIAEGRAKDNLFQKILDFVKKIANAMGASFDTSERVMKDIASGKVWKREVAERSQAEESYRVLNVPFVTVPVKRRGKLDNEVELTAGLPKPEKSRAEQRSRLDKLAKKYPNPLSSVYTWNRFIADATGNEDTGIIPPKRAMEWAKDAAKLKRFLRKMTPGQKDSAEAGLDTAREIGQRFKDGRLGVNDFSMILVWAGLSRQLTASVHEAGFIRAMNNGIKPFVEKAVKGQWTKEDTKAGLKWVEENFPVGGGMPTGAKANLNATFKTTLPALAQAKGTDSQPLLQTIFDMVKDENVPTSEIRREFLFNAGSSGLQTKVFSFALLVAGRTDAIVIDRWQVRNFWAGNKAIENGKPVEVTSVNKSGEKKTTKIPLADALYDKIPMGTNKDGATITSGMAGYLDGPLGMAIYEGLERGLASSAEAAYGDPETGRLHWETWLIINNQEVGHASLDAIKNQTAEGATVTEGRRIISEGDVFAIENGQEVYYTKDEQGNYERFTRHEYQQLPAKTAEKRLRRAAVANRIAVRRAERAVASGQRRQTAERDARAYRRKDAALGVRKALGWLGGRDLGGSSGPYRGEAGKDARRVLAGEAVQAKKLTPVTAITKILTQGGISHPVLFKLSPSKDSARVFHKSITESKAANPFGASVYVYDQAEYEDMQLFLTEDRLAGIAVKSDGDIVSVFNTPGGPHKTPTIPMLLQAIASGGVKLDAFDTYLPPLYSLVGMKAAGRFPWNEKYKPEGWDKELYKEFNDGEPDVVYMVYDPAYAESYRAGDGPYGDAEALQQAEIERIHGSPTGEDVRFSTIEKAEAPKKTVKAYKLFRLIPGRPGELFPLFVDANTPVPIGEWTKAQDGGGYYFTAENGNQYVPARTGVTLKIPNKKIAQELYERGYIKSPKTKSIRAVARRPGWHSGDHPMASHIGGRSKGSNVTDYRRPTEIWAEVEIGDDVDWQTEANNRARTKKNGEVDVGTAHIQDEIPYGGNYRYKTNPNMTGNWLISGELKVNRVLSDAEVKQINDAAGVADLPRPGKPINPRDWGFDSQYSTGRKSAGRSNVRRELAEQIGYDSVRALLRGGTVNVITQDQVAEITGQDRKGFKDKGFIVGGKVYLVEDNIGKGEALDILLHELGSHDYVDQLLGRNMEQFAEILYKESLRDTRQGKALRAAKAMIPKGTRDEHYNSEWIAYYLQHTAKRGDSLYRRIISAIKEALLKMGLSPKVVKLRPQDLRAIALRGIQKRARQAEKKIGTPPGGVTGPVMRSQQADKWYSRLQKTIENKGPKTATAQQWLNTLEQWKKKGTLPAPVQEELEWSGLEDFLKDADPKAKIPRETVSIMAKGIEVEDVIKGDAELDQGEGFYVDETGYNSEWGVFREGEDDPIGGTYRSEEEAQEAMEQMVSDNPTRHARWQLPGGENYRELLLTLPSRDKWLWGYGLTEEENNEYNELAELVDDNLSMTTEQEIRFRELDDKLFEAQRGKKRHDYIGPEGHYSEPNILAHVRFNERVDADGNRVLFLEEVQSDWHQEGRKKGYRGPLTEKPEITGLDDILRDSKMRALELKYNRTGDEEVWTQYEQEKDNVLEKLNEKLDGAGLGNDYFFLSSYDGWKVIEGTRATGGVEAGEGATPQEAYNDLVIGENKLGRLATTGVPNAPFKKTWPMLAMKRMIRYAAENGFDRIAWTTGEQQAERYNLSNQVEAISYYKKPNGTYAIKAKPIGEEGVNAYQTIGSDLTESQLEEHVGKEVAEKIINDEGKDVGNVFKVIDGVNLKVGGKGMKAFYNKMLPNQVGKFIKKYGAKVEPFDLVPGYEEEYGIVNSYVEDKFGVVEGPDGDHAFVSSFLITPEMRGAALSEGMPLFSTEFQQQARNTSILNASIDGKTSDASLSEGERIISEIVRKLAEVSSPAVRETRFGDKFVEDTIESYREVRKVIGDPLKSAAEKQKFASGFAQKLPKEPRAKLLQVLSQISRVKGENPQQKRLKTFLNRADKVLTDHLREQLLEKIKKASFPLKLQKDRIKRGRGAAFERDLKYLREVASQIRPYLVEEEMGRLDGMEQDLSNRLEEATEEAEQAKLREQLEDVGSYRNLLAVFGGLQDQSFDQLARAYKAMAILHYEGRTPWRSQQEIWRRRTERNKLGLIQDITGQEVPERMEESRMAERERSLKGKTKEALSFISNMVQSWELMLDKISGKAGAGTLKSWTVKHFGSIAHKATRDYERLNLESHDAVTEKAKEIFGTDSNFQLAKRFAQLDKREDGKVHLYQEGQQIPLVMSPLEAAYWYQISRDGENKVVQETFSRQGITQRTLDEIEAYMPAELKRWADYLVDEFYQDFHDPVNEVYRQMYGIDLEKTPNYVPWKRKVAGKIADKQYGGLLFDTEMATMKKGSLRERVTNYNAFRIANVNDVLINHIADMNHFRAWALPTKEINSSFNDPDVQHYIRQEVGRDALQTIKKFQNSFAKAESETVDSLQFLDRVRANVTRALIGLNPVVFLKQLASVPAYMSDVPMGAWFKYTAEAMANPVKAARILTTNSTMMKARYKRGFERDIRNAMKMAGGNVVSQQKRIADHVMILTALGDRFAIVAGGYAVYKHNYDKAIVEGKTQAAARQIAVKAFEEATERSQQSGNVKDLGWFQSGSPLMRLFTMFMTAPASYSRQIFTAVRNMKTDPKDSAKRLFVFGVLMPTVFQAIADALLIFDGDDDDKERVIKNQMKAVALGPFNGLPVIRTMAEGYANAISGNSFYQDQYSPVMETFDTSKETVADFMKFLDGGAKRKSGHDYGVEALIGMIHTLGLATGTPTKPLERVFSGWYDAVTGETDHPIRRSLGYSKYAVGEK